MCDYNSELSHSFLLFCIIFSYKEEHNIIIPEKNGDVTAHSI